MTPGVSRITFTATKEFPRFSEGDVIELTDGRLLLVVTRKSGAGDFAAGSIIATFSHDRAASWDDEPRVIQSPWADVVDVMSASLCRSPRGIHLFFLGRGKDARRDTRIYQMLSTDEGLTWSAPVRISDRDGYHVVNNARVIRLAKGRLLIPAAYVSGDIGKLFKDQRVYCIYSDDDGQSWHASNDLTLDGQPLMEPGVVQCTDGSIYMTIRTATGFLYEAHSRDNGATWADLAATKLTSPAAPSTVVREPGGDALWFFYINRPKGAWKDRNPLAFASSHDNGKTWSAPRNIETDPKHSYGYYSVTPVGNQILLTYYDWEDHGQPGFQMTNLRQRLIPIGWFRGQPTPPVFLRDPGAVLPQGQPPTPDILHHENGSFESYTTCVEKPADHRVIARSTSRDAVAWSTPEIILRPDYTTDPRDTQFDSLHVFRRRGFYLGLLFVFHTASQTIEPQWAWSHDALTWHRTHLPCLGLGDEGSFDSRSNLFHSLTQTDTDLVLLYAGSNQRQNHSNPSPTIARATTPLADLDAWLATLPEP